MLTIALSMRLDRDVMSMPSLAGDGAVESYWAMTLSRRLGRDAMLMPSHAEDDAVNVTWL
jgi:hypothetical protein